MASKRLLKFLQDFAQDAKKRKAYRADPEAAMKVARLTATQRAAVRSGDVEKIKKALGTTPRGPDGRALVMSVIVT